MVFENMTRKAHLLKCITTELLCSYFKTHSEESMVTAPFFSSYHETNSSICMCNYVTTKISEDEKNPIYNRHQVTILSKISQVLLVLCIIYGNHTKGRRGVQC